MDSFWTAVNIIRTSVHRGLNLAAVGSSLLGMGWALLQDVPRLPLPIIPYFSIFYINMS